MHHTALLVHFTGALESRKRVRCLINRQSPFANVRRGWEALEEVVSKLEGGDAVAFGSGMAAAVLELVPAGARVMAPTDCYAGVQALLADGQQQGRWQVDLVDITDTAAAEAAARRADLVWLESPTNPLLDVADLPALCVAARDNGALVTVDNTFATPLLQQPIALGAHFAVHSATKFMGGHSDLLLGLAVAGTPELAERFAPPPRGRRRRSRRAGSLPGAAWSAHPVVPAGPGTAQRRRTGPPPHRPPCRHPSAVSRPA